NERACLRLPISMMPRLALKLMLARLRTGIDRVGSLLRSAAAITVSATPTSFFSTAPGALGFARAMRPLYLFFRGAAVAVRFAVGAFRFAVAVVCLGFT